MSLALVHFLFGATIGLWFVTFQPDYIDTDTLSYAFAGGVWAMAPDLAHFAPALDPLHNHVLMASLFALHGFFDVADPNDSIYVAASMVALFGISVGLTRYHDLR